MSDQEITYEYFINRELSWLDFNRRVLNLSKDKAVPLGEQLKFAAIYASNLDEFFMVRVGSLYDQSLLKSGSVDNKTGWTPAQQLDAKMCIRDRVHQRHHHHPGTGRGDHRRHRIRGTAHSRPGAPHRGRAGLCVCKIRQQSVPVPHPNSVRG